MKGKRRTNRIIKADKATILLKSEVNNQQIEKIYHVLTEKLSVKGIKIPIDAFIPVDTSLKIEIFLENPTRVIFTNGIVRWIKCLYDQELYEVGIEFVDMSPEDVITLEKLVRSEE